jgi:hypothetical protein
METVRASLTNHEEIGMAPGFASTIRLFRVDANGELQRPGRIGAQLGTEADVVEFPGRDHTDLVPSAGRGRAKTDVINELVANHNAARVSSPAAVSALLGHPAGGCPTCRGPALTWGAKLVLAAVAGASERGLIRLLRALGPAAAVAVSRDASHPVSGR